MSKVDLTSVRTDELVSELMRRGYDVIIRAVEWLDGTDDVIELGEGNTFPPVNYPPVTSDDVPF